MNRQDILSRAWGSAGPRIGGRELFPLSTHRLRILEIRGNPFFGGHSGGKSEVQALSEVFHVLASPPSEFKHLRALSTEEWEEAVDSSLFDLTEDEVAEFQEFVEGKIQSLNAAGTESEAGGKPDTPPLGHV